MQSEYKENDNYGYILSQIHGRQKNLLSHSAYKALLQSYSLDDILIKLQNLGYALPDTTTTKADLKRLLDSALKAEFHALHARAHRQLRTLLTFFLETYQIESFIYRLSSPEERVEELGFFTELNALKFSKDMDEVKRFVVDNCFLKRYFKRINTEKVMAKNNFQIVKKMLMKYHIEDFYGRITGGGGTGGGDGHDDNSDSNDNDGLECMAFMKRVLEVMGAVQIIEIVLNTLHTTITPANRAKLFPAVNDLSTRTLAQLADCDSVDDLRNILLASKYAAVVRTDDVLHGLQVVMLETYYLSFGVFNDLSCVYCYLKLKEQEIQNIGWIVEFMGESEKNVLENIYCLE